MQSITMPALGGEVVVKSDTFSLPRTHRIVDRRNERNWPSVGARAGRSGRKGRCDGQSSGSRQGSSEQA